MRTSHWCGVVLSGLVVAAALAGPLDPPSGPIAPTPGPEARTAINATNTPGDNDSVFKITEPGSYYLTGNLVVDTPIKMGIEIASPNVTLDLNGFAVSCLKPGPYDGISNTFPNPRNLTVMNGTVEGFGGDGVDLTGVGGDGFRVLNVCARGNTGHGILVEKAALIEGCTAVVNGLNGIWAFEVATIRSCQTIGNGQHGIVAGSSFQVGSNSVVEGCSSVGNGLNGFSLLSGVSVTTCAASGNGQHGFAVQGHATIIGCASKNNGGNGFKSQGTFSAGQGTVGPRHLVSQCEASLNTGIGVELVTGEGTVERCTVTQNGDDGIKVGSRARVMFNTCDNNGQAVPNGAGVHATGNDCVIESNMVTGGDRGILVDLANNLIIRNVARMNSVNFQISANNKVGVCVAAPSTVGGVLGDTGGAGVGTTDPNANIVY